MKKLNWPWVILAGAGCISLAGFVSFVLSVIGVIAVCWLLPVTIWIFVPAAIMWLMLLVETRR